MVATWPLHQTAARKIDCNSACAPDVATMLTTHAQTMLLRQIGPSDAESPDLVASDSGYLVLVIAIVAIGLVLFALAIWKARKGAPGRAPDEPTVGGRQRHSAAVSARTKVFVSYRRDDSPYVAGRVFETLVERFGTGAVLRDVDSFPLGVDFRRSIDHAVADATVVLVVVGRSWLGAQSTTDRRIDSAADFVRIEIAAALARGIPVVPLLVDGAAMPDATTLPEDIREFAFRNAVPIRPDPDFGNDMDRLVRGIVSLETLKRES